MQGLIYTILADMVIDMKGIPFWNEVIRESNVASKGAYTTGVQYDDEELFAIVEYLEKALELPQAEIIKLYGVHLFPILLEKMPVGSLEMSSMKRFLLQIDEVIHKEVKRVNPDVYLPEFQYIDPGKDELVMLYRSKRKLCPLSEGLIIGAGKHFNTEVTINHPICMHDGADHCRLEIIMVP
ncbi:guanylate cyclase [Aliikangiella marina]|uniref:Guanylate cyclase n=1 Tax=Aliikangiella marina TaxID=1712262 RepID=A0A545T9A1_9GAMM|nr:heme NO-binding domain-containing protein [Aliikangiella marina]TQV73778.1 guanylate cyclase [Aliikangiella marina]